MPLTDVATDFPLEIKTGLEDTRFIVGQTKRRENTEPVRP
jgi:hypothetical protein